VTLALPFEIILPHSAEKVTVLYILSSIVVGDCQLRHQLIVP